MKTRFFAFAALALSLAACNNDNENLNDGPVAAKFTADIYESVSTRVNQDEPTGPTATASASPAQATPTCPTRERTVSS